MQTNERKPVRQGPDALIGVRFAHFPGLDRLGLSRFIIPIISQNARVKMAIDSRGFIVMAKRYAVDDTVQACVNQLKAPQVPKSLPEASDPVQEASPAGSKSVQVRSDVGQTGSTVSHKTSRDWSETFWKTAREKSWETSSA
jgi:hypothetical protein